MTVALLEGREPSKSGAEVVANSSTSTAVTESLMALLLDGVSDGVENGAKGKTPRIDIRLSLNGGSIEAVVPEAVSHVTVVDGEPEHKRLCRRTVAKFTAPLNWDSAAAKAQTGGSQETTTETPDSKSSRLLDFVFAAGDRGRPFDQIRDRFGDSKLTNHLIRKLLEDQKIFLLGRNEPRYVHWAHLRLWLIHVKDPKNHQRNESSSCSNAATASTDDEVVFKRRRLSLAVSAESFEKLTRTQSMATDSGSSAFERLADDEKSQNKDYYFIPQPWICESGVIKTNFFTHLIQSACSMISRLSGSPMDVLACQYRHILSPVSFRILCHFLHDVKVVQISRVVYNTKCSLFSKPDPVIYLGDQFLLAPARELSLSLEPQFVSRMNTLFACLSESFGHTPEEPSPYVKFTRCRAPRDANVLCKQAEEGQGEADLET
uniref:B-block_TFIIIC domain-containing protein n=1 Tax=Mesocestoides corti TaxID=53468 RepID=A0A5K3EN17_MESCO